MGKYVVRRLLQMIPVVIGATFILFALVFALPGDPTAGRCGERPCPPSYVAAFRAEYHLDDSLLTQYGIYLGPQEALPAQVRRHQAHGRQRQGGGRGELRPLPR